MMYAPIDSFILLYRLKLIYVILIFRNESYEFLLLFIPVISGVKSGTITGVIKINDNIPADYFLLHNYANPFNTAAQVI